MLQSWNDKRYRNINSLTAIRMFAPTRKAHSEHINNTANIFYIMQFLTFFPRAIKVSQNIDARLVSCLAPPSTFQPHPRRLASIWNFFLVVFRETFSFSLRRFSISPVSMLKNHQLPVSTQPIVALNCPSKFCTGFCPSLHAFCVLRLLLSCINFNLYLLLL